MESKIKQLKKFWGHLTVETIYSVLEAVDDESEIEKAARIMNEKNFDIYGFKKNGLICGYFARDTTNRLKVSSKPIELSSIISIQMSLEDCINKFRGSEHLFVLDKDGIKGLACHADLNKQPVRMLLFCSISLLEISLLELIKKNFFDSWRDHLSEGKLKIINTTYNQQKNNNIETEELECLGLLDRFAILLENKNLDYSKNYRNKIGLSKKSIDIYFCKL